MRGVIILCLLFASFSKTTAQPATPEYFEGYIDYKAEFKSYMPGVSDNELRDRIGNFVRIYFKNGNFKWELKDDAGYVRNYMLYLVDKNITYSWADASPDTLYTFDVSSDRRLRVDSFSEGINEKVLDCDCRQIIMHGFTFYERDADSSAIVLKYFFCSGLKANPGWYKNYKEME